MKDGRLVPEDIQVELLVVVHHINLRSYNERSRGGHYILYIRQISPGIPYLEDVLRLGLKLGNETIEPRYMLWNRGDKDIKLHISELLQRHGAVYRIIYIILDIVDTILHCVVEVLPLVLGKRLTPYICRDICPLFEPKELIYCVWVVID